MPDSIPSLPDWLSRGMADLFPAGDPSDADQALAARLAQADKENRPLRVKLGIDPTGQFTEPVALEVLTATRD